MGKKRKSGGSARPKRQLDSDEEAERMADPDPKSRSFMFDEVDEFHENKQKVLLEGAKKYESHRVESDDEEIYGLDLSSDEEDFEEKHRQFYDNYQKDQMDSDLEDDTIGHAPDDKAWGRMKSTYYDTDYVDKGHREDESELAEAEEKEGKIIQQRMAGELDDQDFDLDLFAVAKKAPEEKETLEEVVDKDLSKLSKQEKIEIVKRESPELLVLLEDLKRMISETKERLLPLVSLIERGVIADGPAATFLKTKYNVLINYFTNACFYVMLKVKRTPLTNHPIIERILSYRRMMTELFHLDEKLQDEVDAILTCIGRSGDVERVLLTIGRRSQPQKSPKKPLGILRKKPSPTEVEISDIKPKENRISFVADEKRKRTSGKLADDASSATFKKPAANEDWLYEEGRLLPKRAKLIESVKDRTSNVADAAEEQAPVVEKETRKPTAEELKAIGDQIHQARKKAGEMLQVAKKSLSAVNEQNGMPAAEEEFSLDDFVAKRPINFQIAKNKGLTPYRKKEDANPRVKYRKKFQKAVSRRKGQVRDVKREDKRYGGEASGIRAATTRSVKFK